MEASSRTAANRIVFERFCAAEPVLVDVAPAIDVLPGLTRDTVLTSGPALPFKDYVGGQRNAVAALHPTIRARRRVMRTAKPLGD